MSPEETSVLQIPSIAPVTPTEQLPVAIPTSEIQPEISPAPKTPKSNKKMFMIFGVILLLVVLIGIGVFAFTAMQKPEDKMMVEPTPSPETVMEKDSTDTEEDVFVNPRTQQMHENINAAKVYIEKHQDLEKELAAMKIIYAQSLKASDSTIEGWLIQARDENKSNAIQADYPQYIYLATDNSWKMIDGPLPVECEIINLVPVWGSADVETVIVGTECSQAGSVKLFSFPSGEQIPLSDPDGLIPADSPWVIGEDGSSGGVIVGEASDELFEVSYGHAEVWGKGIFSTKTGNLLDLIIYADLVD